MIRRAATVLGRVLYPDRCALCGRIDRSSLCLDCLAEFSPLPDPFVRHVPGAPIEAILSLYTFDGRAAQAVKRLKYERATALAEPLSQLIVEGMAQFTNPRWQVAIPVPIHWSRRCTRGFNQAELLAERLPRDFVDARLLRRRRRTRPQVGLTPAQRLINLRGAFSASPEVADKHILLVDDVVTTGGTLIACASALHSAGAKSVSALTLCGERLPDSAYA